jgi:tripartite-type tricarboxylate transporter receptor subunit TctC
MNRSASPSAFTAWVTAAPMLAALFLAFCAVIPSSAAEVYPSRSIRIVVPYPPGGNTDVVARLYAEQLSGILGVSTVIDNRGGSGGAIGVELAAHAKPDGYTLLHATDSELTVLPAVRPDLRYDPRKDLMAVSTTSKFPFVLVVRKDLPASSFADLVALAKQKPGKLTFGSVGIGSANHLATELFQILLKVDVVHVPYSGGGPVMTDLLGGHLDAGFATVSSILSQVRSGDLRALLVTSKDRISQLPDIPSAGELGLSDLVVENWTAFFAPAGTDPTIVATLHDAIVRAGAASGMIAAVDKAGADVATSTPSAAAALLASDLARWMRVAREKGIKIE